MVSGRQPTSKVVGHFKWRATKALIQAALGELRPCAEHRPSLCIAPPSPPPRPFPTPLSPLLRLCPALPLGWAPHRNSSVSRERPTFSSFSAPVSTHAPPLHLRPTLLSRQAPFIKTPPLPLRPAPSVLAGESSSFSAPSCHSSPPRPSANALSPK